MIQLQGNRLLLQRIGVLKPVRQRKLVLDRETGLLRRDARHNGRSPESRGLWAMPYPYFDAYLASYQFEMALSPRLKERMHKLHAACRDGEIDSVTFEAEMAPLRERRDQWLTSPEGRKTLKVRRFWVSGKVYTHLGTPSDDGEWVLVSVTELARRLRREFARDCAHVVRSNQRWGFATQSSGRHDGRGWPTCTDHLEIFLGREAKIH